MNLHLHRREKNEAYHLTLGDRATRYIVGWAVSLSCDQTQWQAILDYSDGGPTYMDRYEHLLLYADGSVQPQRAGAGVIALDRWSKVVFLGNRTLPPMTNNEAEYMGLIFTLETAVDLNGQFIQIRLDSEVVVNQMIGRFAVNSPA
ncbi:MAG: reverse transcriptase-like protein, partial [Anaerolineae bacterium]|nr:reverse transcriptase-like protein [Anaerolineae bacterium]